MKIKNIILFLSLFLFATVQLFAQNTSPVVSSVAFTISGTTVSVTYNLADAENTEFEVVMNVSDDNGATWGFDYGAASGDIGSVSGTGGKTITWTYNGGAANFKIRIIAQDKTAGGSPCAGTATVSYGGQTYNTIQLGDQCWLKEYLNIGTRIDHSVTAVGSNGTIEKYCYADVEANCDYYGGLYLWDELMQGSTTEGVQGICPSGWHVPSFSEYAVLNNFMKAAIGTTDMGKSLVSTASSNGTDISGFAALSPGYISGGSYSSLDGAWINIFTSSQKSATELTSIYTSANDNVEIPRWDSNGPSVGYAVRCIKD